MDQSQPQNTTAEPEPETHIIYVCVHIKIYHTVMYNQTPVCVE